MEFNEIEINEILKFMKMYKVYSSNLNAIGYNQDKKILRVIFKNNTSYLYFGVEPEIWDLLYSSEHKGRTLSECVIKQKDRYKYLKIM